MGNEQQALLQAALAAHQQGRWQEAEQGYSEVLEQDPSQPDALHFLGLLYHQRGDPFRAEEWLSSAIEEAPNQPLIRYHLGLVLEAMGRDWEAAAAYDRTLRVKPGLVGALNNRSNVRERLGDKAGAEADIRQALTLNPDFPQARNNLAGLLWAQEDRIGALEEVNQALALDPTLEPAYRTKVSFLLAMESFEAAEQTVRSGLAHHPHSPQLLTLLGQILRALGRSEEAIKALQEAISQDPQYIKAYHLLAQFMDHHGVDLDPATLESWLASSQEAPEERALLAFGLGDFYASREEPNEAFLHWLQGNQLRAGRNPFHPVDYSRELQAWVEAFPPEVLDSLRDWGVDSAQPVFVVGMPRSGTTLVEQILSAHPRVAGAGEAGGLWGLLGKAIREQAGGLDPERWDHLLTPDKARELGTRYLAKLEELVGYHSRIINKTPDNFFFLGLIQALMPNAQVICCWRDALDSGLSMFSKNFGNVPYAYSLEAIGEVQQGFSWAMAQWRERCDSSLLLEVQYEDLVSDPGEEVGRLLRHCGLEWHEDCLNFFDNPRPVRTASAVQVRQPLYGTSAGRWRSYGARLLPLARRLGVQDRLPPPSELQAFSDLGHRQLDQGHFREAEGSFRAALLHETDKAALHGPLGRALEKQGRWEEARICWRWLWEHEGGGARLFMALARVARKTGRLEEAEQWLAAMEGTGGLDEETLLEQGCLAHARLHLVEAEEAYRRILADRPGPPEACLGLAVLEQGRGRRDTARQWLMAGMAHAPVPAWFQAAVIGFLIHTQELDKAEEVLRDLLQQAPRYPRAYLQLARLHLARQSRSEAYAATQQALELDPDYPEGWALQGLVLQEQGYHYEAWQACRTGLACGGQTSEFWHLYGQALFGAGWEEMAMPALDQAVALAPWDAGIRADQVQALERLSRLEEGQGALAVLQEHFPAMVATRFWSARLARRSGRLEEAVQWLGPLMEDSREAEGGHLAEMGQLLDKLDRPDEAFEYFRRANAWMRERPEAQRAPKERYLGFLDQVDWAMRDAEAGQWPAAAPSTGWDAPPVFLVGFPRSGTTLLDQILTSHPEVAVMEEENTFQPLWARLRERFGDPVEGLREADGGEIRGLQALYGEMRARYVQEGYGRLIIDKMPLRSAVAGVLHRIFPDARFIFARRHPCDCILSSFMQMFHPNPAMANFYTLEEGVELYKRVMRLWDAAAGHLPLSYHEVRYEDLVGDFDREVGALLDFLGLAWSDSVRDFRATAMARGRIGTPSYTQVTQPIYRDAALRWRRYRTFFEPYLEDLRPFAEPAGYSVE